MELCPTELDDVLLVRPTIRSDERGTVRFVWNEKAWGTAGLPRLMATENHIGSHLWVLRGVHRQINAPQGKLVRVLQGQVYDVGVDLRPGSATFGRWFGYTWMPRQGTPCGCRLVSATGSCLSAKVPSSPFRPLLPQCPETRLRWPGMILRSRFDGHCLKVSRP